MTPVTDDRFFYLGPSGAIRLPNIFMPPLMSNHGNYIVSLGDVVRWLGEQAAELGVEIYPGFAAAEYLTDANGAVIGVATGDMGVGRDGKPNDNFVRGMELKGKYTLIAEGARGSLSKQLIRHFKLDADCDPQKYGIGLKELWEVKPDKHKPGLVQHSFGWPLDNRNRRGNIPLSLRQQPRRRRLRAAPQLPEPLPVALRRVPALQDPPRHRPHLRGRQAHRLRRTRVDGGRLAVDPETDVPRWRAARLLGRLHECAAHQGQP